MKTNLYFPFEINMINSDNVSELIETFGPKGFGVYLLVLTELRHSPNNRCSLNAIKGMARRCKISNTLLIKVLNNFRLFELNEDGDVLSVSSPYLDRVMSAYEEKRRKLSEAGKKGYDKVSRNANGHFTAKGGALDKIRLDKNKTTTVVTGEAPELYADVNGETDGEIKNDIAIDTAMETADQKMWEKHLMAAMQDETWVEALAMNSGISKLFVKHRAFVVETFRNHVLLQGNGQAIQSVSDIQRYFANFLRPGTPTHKRIAGLLRTREEEIKQTSHNRYETIDPETGERSYFGNPIPPDAPPRPNDNAVWSKGLNEWIL